MNMYELPVCIAVTFPESSAAEDGDHILKIVCANVTRREEAADINMRVKIKVVLGSNEKDKHAKRMRNARKEWTVEQKEKNRELSRLRMKAYRDRKKEKQSKPDDRYKMATRQEQKQREEKNNKSAEYRRQYRANLSSQKKRRVREKDAARKREKRANTKKTTGTQPGTPAGNTTSDQSKHMTDSALKKAVYHAKKRLPKSPRRFAEVVSGIVQNATPHKKQALKMKGLDSMAVRKDLNNILQSIKEVDEGMRGRDKISRTKRKLFMGSLSSQIKKRHGMTAAFSAALGIQRKYLSQGCTKEQKKRKDCISKETEESVKNFFYQDNISTNLPNKKNIKKDAVESRVLEGTLDSTWNRFKDDHPNNQISFDKFTKLKPKEVKTQKHRKYLQCLCEYCENLRLKIVKINKLADTNEKPQLKMRNVHEALKLTLCPKTGPFHGLKCVDRECEECGPATLRADLQAGLEETDQEWKKWALQVSVNKRTGKEIKKKELTIVNGKTSDLIDEFIEESLSMSKHLFEANWQISQFGNLIKNLPPNTIALAIDFAENYSCTSQNEVQSAHWSKESVTVHPTVVYYRCPNCPEDIVEECCDIISEDLTHDAHAVNAFLHKVFTYLKEKRGLTISKAFIMSDGCASQYKSKIPFSDAANAITEFGFIIQRDYYGSRHGKNRCDGEGGVIKSRVTRAVKNGEAEIVSASDFYTFCRDHIQKESPDTHGKCVHKRRHLFFVALEDIRRPRPERNVRTVQGTQKLHSLVGVDREMIKTRRLSCFCQECLYGRPEGCQQKEYVDQWKQVRLKYFQHPGIDNEVQPPAFQVQPVDMEVQPPFVQLQPVDMEVQLPSVQVQPVDIQIQSPAVQVQPVDMEVQPSAVQVLPVDIQIQPPAVQVQPVDMEVQPPSVQVRPVDIQIQPPAVQVQPVDIQVQPTTVHLQPVDMEVQPPSVQLKPVDIQVTYDRVLPLDVEVPFQLFDVQVQPLDVQIHPLGEMIQPALDCAEHSEIDRVDCSYEEESDASNSMDISGLTGILEALEKEQDDFSLSPIISILKDERENEREESSLSKEPRPGDFLKIRFGNSLLPAVVDQWPFVHYFKKGALGWIMQEIRHTVIEEDIEGRLEAPSVEAQGRSIIYKFEDLES